MMNDPFSELARTHAAELGVLLRAVAYGAILTLRPDGHGLHIGTLESTGAAPVRLCVVQGLTLASVLIELAQKWSKSPA